jgi:hypothetical protein
MVAPYRFRQKPPRESAIYASVPAARPVTSQALNSPGIAPETRAPVVLVEAKAYDVGAARQPRGQNLDARGMADLISGAIGDLKSDHSTNSAAQRFAEWYRPRADGS